MKNPSHEIYRGFPAPSGFGVIPLERLAADGGLKVLKAIAAGELPSPPIGEGLCFGLAEAGEGHVVFRGMPNESHLNPLGTIHGGYAAAILDSALACAVMTTLSPGEGYTTVEFKVNLTRPILADTGEVVCEGRLVHRGRTTATSEAYLRDGQGRLLAHGTETCAIFPIDRALKGRTPAGS